MCVYQKNNLTIILFIPAGSLVSGVHGVKDQLFQNEFGGEINSTMGCWQYLSCGWLAP
jgi:hypothetical protein